MQDRAHRVTGLVHRDGDGRSARNLSTLHKAPSLRAEVIGAHHDVPVQSITAVNGWAKAVDRTTALVGSGVGGAGGGGDVAWGEDGFRVDIVVVYVNVLVQYHVLDITNEVRVE